MVIAAAALLPGAVAIRRHPPPYKQMIVAAIESLNEKNGSNRAAISKFIAANFSDLPPAHHALLTTHIRRLKKHNVLRKVNHSYMIVGDVGASVPARKRHGRPPISKGGDPKADPTAHGRRKRGRPSKLSILADAATLNGDVIRGHVVVNDALQQLPVKRKPGRPKVLLTSMQKVIEVDDNATLLTPMQKVIEVDDNATLFSPMSLSSGNVVTKAELDPDPVIAAATVLFEMRNRDMSAKVSLSSTLVEDKNATFLNPGLESPINTLAGLKSGVDPIPVSLTTLTEKRKPDCPRKFLSPSPPLLGHDSLIMQKPVMNSLREVVGEVEIVMPNIRRRGCPPKMNGKEEE